MKKSFMLLAAALSIFLFSSCLTTGSAGKKSSASAVSQTPSNYKRENIDTSVWNLKKLDTARNVSYLSELEKDIILETNMARSNPKKYCEMYIEPRKKNFDKKIYHEGSRNIKTNEGVSVVKEAVRFLKKQKPVQILNPSFGLTQSARDHAISQSKTKQTGHNGTDGSTPFKRIKRYGSYKTAGENITYGVNSAWEIVANLIIDDGVKDRGHRKNIFLKDFDCSGLCYVGEHKIYGSECVINYAGNYKEK
ncbi:MAG: CAP domain-containing protein [Treponema sp.]|nr:CAP domain-containing protein [Treponema sp.]